MNSIGQSELVDLYVSDGAIFSMVVAFSGLEHDGLGRNGDPVNPNGDVAALHEIFLLLKPGGIPLLAFPTCFQDMLYYPNHRFYGPLLLEFLLAHSGFVLIGRVWNGAVIKGGMSVANEPPSL